MTNPNDYQEAFLAIEYRSEASEAFEELKSLPREHQIAFLKQLQNNPQGDVEQFKKNVLEDYEKWLNPFENQAFNEQLNFARSISQEVEQEFMRVVEVIGQSSDPAELLNKIKEKFSQTNEAASVISLDDLCSKYNVSSESLMDLFGIKYKGGVYEYDGKRYESFIDAARIADQSNAFGYLQPSNIKEDEAEEEKEALSKPVHTEEKGFFSKLVNGDLGLAKTFWLYGIVVRLFISLPVNMIYVSSPAGSRIMFILVSMFAIMIYETLMFIGVWNAAGKYQGPSIWRYLSILFVIVNAVSWALIITGTVSQL